MRWLIRFALAALYLGVWLALLLLAPHARAETMRSSYYGAESGTHTASGKRFNPMGLTAAHRSLPFGTRLRVCYRGCVDLVVTDRGPALWTHRSLDISHGAAIRIGLVGSGVANVSVERL
jgi:rare lipoprotein A